MRQVFALGTSGGNDGIINVRIVRDRSKNLGKGFGYVQFSDRSYAKEALALNGTFLDNRQLRIVKVSTKSQLEEKKQRKLEKKQTQNGANSNGDKKAKNYARGERKIRIAMGHIVQILLEAAQQVTKEKGKIWSIFRNQESGKIRINLVPIKEKN